MSWQDQAQPADAPGTPPVDSPMLSNWQSKAQPEEEPRTVLPQLPGHIIPAALSVLEQPGAGLYGLMQDAVAGSMSLFTAGIDKFRGEDYGKSFVSEYNMAKDSMPEYVPITPGGHEVTKVLSGVIGRAVQSYGDTAYQIGRLPIFPTDALMGDAMEKAGIPGSPLAGSLGQAAATLGILAATPGAKEAKLPTDPVQLFKMKYPRTDAMIDGSRVGKIVPSLKATDPTAPIETAQVKVSEAVNNALNEELGIDPSKIIDLNITTADKLKMVIAKYGTDVPMADQIRLANAYADKFKKLQDYQDAVIASRPKLEDKSQTITITPKGTALLAEHMQSIINGEVPKTKLQGGSIDIALLTPSLANLKKSLSNVKGIVKDAHGGVVVFRGRNNTPPEEAAMPRLKDYAAAYVTDNPYLANTFAHLEQDVIHRNDVRPSKVYPFVIRDNVEIKEFPGEVDQNGNFSYSAFDEFAKTMGPNQIAVIRDSADAGGGSSGIKHVGGPIMAKNDQYAFTDPSVLVPLFDFLAGPQGKARWQHDVAMWKGKTAEKRAAMKGEPSDLDFTNQGGAAPVDPSWQYDQHMQSFSHPSGAVVNKDLSGEYYSYDSEGKSVGKFGNAQLAKAAALKGTAEHQHPDGFILDPSTNTWYHPDSPWWKIEVQPDGYYIHDESPSHEPTTKFASLKQAKQAILGTYGGGKQGGSIDLAGIEKNLPAAKRALGKGSAAWAIANPEQAAHNAEKALEDNYKAVDESSKIFSKKTLESIRRATVQHDYDLQHDLERAGPYGEQARLRMNVEHNATMIAKTRYDKTVRQIFDDLKPDERKNLEKIIRARRIVQIDAYKGPGVIRHEGNTSGPEQTAFLAALEKRLGSEAFKRLDGKADTYFGEEKINLKRLMDEGLIDQETFDKMKNLDYSRTEYLDAIDPEIPITSKIKGISSIRSSGIPRLSRGKETAVNMNARDLLIEDIARVENRIARNKTLQAVYALAENNPGNGIVELSKSVSKDGEVKVVPEGWTSIGVRIEGKQKHVLMRNTYAEQFGARRDIGNQVVIAAGDHQLTLGAILRTVSGASLIRATATTYNPSFIIAGLPMDIIHLWMASKDVYSPHLPIYLAQIGKDLAATAKDAILHKGEWTQAMQEGMGPNFMTHEYRTGLTAKLPGVSKVETLKKWLSYAGDTQDAWVRLAHRHRLIEQGYSSADATAMAVARLNYYTGGVLTKFVDTVIPYTNITVNATNRAIENAAADPKGSFTKIAWLTGVASAAKIASMITSPETDKAISAMDKVRNFNITFGDQWFVTDPDGNKRYVYVPIRIDQVVMPFNAVTVAALEQIEYGHTPDGVFKEAIGQVNPLSTMFPPILNAIRAYSDNYDPFRDSLVYKGPKINPEDQVRSYAKGQPTSKFFEAVGKATGTSPMGLQAAAGQLVNTNNFWLQAMGAPLRYMFGGMDPREQAESTLQLLQGTPLSRIVKLTTPGTQMMKDLETAEMDFNSKNAKQVRQLDELMFQMQHQQGGVTSKSIENWINAQPQADREKLQKHAKYTFTVDKVMRTYKASDGIPPKGWWISSAKIPDEARAQVFYNEWISADADGRKRMMEIANALHNNGVGYLSPRFQKQFAKERQLLKDDQR